MRHFSLPLERGVRCICLEISFIYITKHVFVVYFDGSFTLRFDRNLFGVNAFDAGSRCIVTISKEDTFSLNPLKNQQKTPYEKFETPWNETEKIKYKMRKTKNREKKKPRAMERERLNLILKCVAWKRSKERHANKSSLK